MTTVDDMTSAQTARALGLSTSTVLRIDPEELPHRVTPGGHRRYRAEDVDRYRERLARGAAADAPDRSTD